MFALSPDEEYCQFCVLIVSKPHDCEKAKRLAEQNANRDESNYAPAVSWKCGGATRGYDGGPGTGIPRVTNINPGHQSPTLATLGLTAEHGKKLGL